MKKLHKIIRIIILLLILMSCKAIATKNAVEWLNSNPHPVDIYKVHYERHYLPRFTFIDATGQVYYAGQIKLTLPDSIH